MTPQYRFPCKVISVEEEKGRRHVSGFGPDAVFREFPIGWKLTLFFAGERVGIFSKDRFDFDPGTELECLLRPRNPPEPEPLAYVDAGPNAPPPSTHSEARVGGVDAGVEAKEPELHPAGRSD